MDRQERARLVGVALRVVLGDLVDRLAVEEHEDVVMIGDAGNPGRFGVWVSDDAQGADPPPYLEHAIDGLVDELAETGAVWGMRLPLCPLHPDVHALSLEVGADEVRCVCPAAGVVRTVAV